MYRNLLRKGIIVLILIAANGTALALTNDQNKPYHVVSNSVMYDRNAHKTIYKGDVIIRQGSTRLTGDKVIVFDKRNQDIEELIAYGNLAHYSTLPDHEAQRLFAEAKRIDYHPQKKTVTLEGNAKVTQKNNVFKGQHIWYDIGHGVVRSLPTSTHDRTVVIIEPQKTKHHANTTN